LSQLLAGKLFYIIRIPGFGGDGGADARTAAENSARRAKGKVEADRAERRKHTIAGRRSRGMLRPGAFGAVAAAGGDCVGEWWSQVHKSGPNKALSVRNGRALALAAGVLPAISREPSKHKHSAFE
jgi:hypothetical protein